MLPDIETIKSMIESAVSGAKVDVVKNPSPSGQGSIVIDNAHALAAARYLKESPQFRLDYASNVTGVDWLDRVEEEKITYKKVIDGIERLLVETKKHFYPGYLEVVYHLYSMELGHGPLILRLRTGNRADDVSVPSLTPIWRGAELQEREVYDLFGIKFDGHPDLRRILMWEGFAGHPMRKDYIEPDDYEYEPTPHGEVLKKAMRHYPQKQEGEK
ncbi:MAG: NADH-quinone oxidoreductase subunit C [Verrucomicrobiia bacterium]